MRLSVIIPVYNVEQYLERCVMSIVNQDVETDDYEIILVNDGSTDSSYVIACDLAEKYPNIRLYSQENKGQGAARNLGIRVAKGNYILFVDSDDYLLPNAFKRMLEAAEVHQLDILVMQSKSMKEDGTFQQIYCAPLPTETVFDGRHILLAGYRPASVWAKLFRHQVIIDTIGGFVEGIIHEDVDFDMKLFTYARRVMFLNLCFYIYYWNSSSTDKLMNHDKIMKSMCSDVVIASDLKAFSSKKHLDMQLQDVFLRHSNSLIASLCYALLTRYKYLPYSDKKYIVRTMKGQGIFPVKGGSNSCKTNRFLFLLKKPLLLLSAFRLQSLLLRGKSLFF